MNKPFEIKGVIVEIKPSTIIKDMYSMQVFKIQTEDTSTLYFTLYNEKIGKMANYKVGDTIIVSFYINSNFPYNTLKCIEIASTVK